MTTPALKLDPLATFSPCGLYRYTLTRVFRSGGKMCTFLMLNPSTADAVKLDPTVTRCKGFAEAWDYDGIHVVNLYAFRTPSPKVLWEAARAGTDVVGPDNDHFIREIMKRTSLVVAAWGGNAKPDRPNQVHKIVRESGHLLRCLTLTSAGQPGHPLYLSKNLEPVFYKTSVRLS